MHYFILDWLGFSTSVSLSAHVSLLIRKWDNLFAHSGLMLFEILLLRC